MTNAEIFLAGAAAGAFAAGFAVWRLGEARLARYGRLLSFALHELNTPLTAVNMTAVNLLSGIFGDVPEGHVKWLEMAKDQLGRLGALTGELRDLVHMELRREFKATASEADPAEIVETSLDSLRRGFVHAGLDLRAEIDGGLPAVRTDADRASRSLSSLLYHARKFRSSGPVILRVRREGAAVACRVEYHGMKIPPAEVRESLRLFYPARARRDQLLSAAGLGLGLVAEVMRRSGGALAFEVDEDGRSRLTLSLPLAEAG